MKRLLSLVASLGLVAFLLSGTASSVLGTVLPSNVVTWQLPAGAWVGDSTFSNWVSGQHLSGYPGPSPQSQTFPQTLVGVGDLTPPCGQWAQVDYYKIDGQSDQTLLASLLANGTLTWNNGPADGAIFSSEQGYGFKFVYGGDCPPPPPTTATLTLIKSVDNSAGGTAADTDWTLSATGPDTISGKTGDVSITNATVTPGTYQLAETGGPDNYTAGTWKCVSADDPTSSDSVTLAAGDDVTCTIINTYVPPQVVCPTDLSSLFTYTVGGGSTLYKADPDNKRGFDYPLVSVTVQLKNGAEIPTGCSYSFSLNSYDTQGATWATSGTQSEIGHDSITFDADHQGAQTLSVPTPACFGQTDFYTGLTKYDGVDGALPHYNDSNTPPDNELIAWSNGGQVCTSPTPPTVTTSCGGSVTFSNVPEGWSVLVDGIKLSTGAASSETFSEGVGTHTYSYLDEAGAPVSGGSFSIVACVVPCTLANGCVINTPTPSVTPSPTPIVTPTPVVTPPPPVVTPKPSKSPKVTPPPTDMAGTNSGSSGGPLPLVLTLLGALMVALVLVTPRRARGKR